MGSAQKFIANNRAPRVQIEYDVELAEQRHPELRLVADNHATRCWMYHDADGNVRARPLNADGPRT